MLSLFSGKWKEVAGIAVWGVPNDRDDTPSVMLTHDSSPCGGAKKRGAAVWAGRSLMADRPRGLCISVGNGYDRSAVQSSERNAPRRKRTSPKSVILSDRRESKVLRTDFAANVPEVRRSFDFGLRPALRMTGGVAAASFRQCTSSQNRKIPRLLAGESFSKNE